MRWPTGVAAALAVFLASGRATGDDSAWDPSWTCVAPWEYVATAAVVAGAATARFAFEPPPARMRGGLLFDDGVRDALRVGSRAGREDASRWSDWLWYASMGLPLVVDSLLVTLAIEGEARVAWQLAWTQLEVISLAAFLATASENLGRERPMAQGCPDGADPDEVCGTGEENRSLLSGHAVAGFAGAGLVCATHQNMALWGGGMADVAACAGFLGIASANAALRVASDNHWASDVLLSGGLGFAMGYFVPSLLRFGLGQGRRSRPLAVVPLFGQTRGLVLAGAL